MPRAYGAPRRAQVVDFGEDRRGREDSRVAVGQTEAGRTVRVIYVSDPQAHSVFVITAYELTGKPLAAYTRRRRRRGR